MTLPRTKAIEELLELYAEYGDNFKSLHPAARIKILAIILPQLEEDFDKTYNTELTNKYVQKIGEKIEQMPYRQKITACQSLLSLL